jgi:DNA-binding transcriptional LysR family regulator
MNQLIARAYQFKFDLKQLRSFLAVAEKLSFRQAAEELFISQPALSRHIAQLEAVLECKLFVRDKNRVTLTASGESLYRDLPAILEQLYQATSALSGKDGKARTIRIGYTCAVMASFFPGLIRAVREALPDHEFEFLEAMDDKLIDDVLHHRLEGAFTMSRPNEAQLKCVDIRPEPMGLMMPDNHFLAGRKVVPLSALAKETLILFPRHINPMLYEQIISHCEKAGFAPHAIKEAPSGHVAIGLVAAGAGIAFIAESMASVCLKGTCFRPLSKPVPEVKYSFITHQHCQGDWPAVFERYIHQNLSPERNCGQALDNKKTFSNISNSAMKFLG